MTDTKFTPGPWSYRPQEYDDWGMVRGPADEQGRQWIVANARAGGPSRQSDDEHRRNGTDPYEANARLIAAAPELYEALERLLVNIDTSISSGAVRDSCRQANRALAQARGDLVDPLEQVRS